MIEKPNQWGNALDMGFEEFKKWASLLLPIGTEKPALALILMLNYGPRITENLGRL